MLIPSVLAETWVSQENFDCNVCCVENDKFSITTTVKNNGTGTLWIGNAKLVSKEGKEFAFYKPAGFEFRKGLLSEESINFNYQGIWPKPSSKNSLFYKQCLYVGTLGNWVCEEDYKEKIMAKSIDVQCYNDEDCPFDKICEVNEDCTVLTCETISIAKECGRIERGDWRPYECCLDEDCKENQYCLDNHCEQVKCNDCGYIYDHSCIEFDCCDNIGCESDKICINNKCKELECGYCEYAEGHECKSYECCEDNTCKEDETCQKSKCQKVTCETGYIENRKCLSYPCTSNIDCGKDYFRCEEGFCKEIKCGENEIIKDYSCEKLKSTPFGYIKENRYISYFSKEAYQDNKDKYTAMFVLVCVLIITLIFSKITLKIKERKKRNSYVLIKANK